MRDTETIDDFFFFFFFLLFFFPGVPKALMGMGLVLTESLFHQLMMNNSLSLFPHFLIHHVKGGQQRHSPVPVFLFYPRLSTLI